jgi:manganese/zinc/iron transport system permease protein
MTGLLELFRDYTIQNVVIGAALLGVSSGVLGSFAVLRKQSLLGDTLSHAALPGVCLGFILAGSRQLGSILLGALVTGILAALVVLLLTRKSRLKTDAALGVALSVFFAVGVVLLTYIQGTGNASQGGLNSFLFGQAAAILRSDLWVMGGITLFAVALVMALWKELKLVTFDPGFAVSLGLPVTLLEVVLTAMIALAVVIGLQMVGVVLMAAMIIAPAAAARQWSRRLEGMVVLAALIGAFGGVVGAVLSTLNRGFATGPLIVLSISAMVAVSLLAAPGRGLVWKAIQHQRGRRHLRTQQVLTTLYQFSRQHHDPHYKAEQGMVNAYYGLGTEGTLAKLQRRGLVKPVLHTPEKDTHWELTAAGRAEAERVLRDLTPRES